MNEVAFSRRFLVPELLNLVTPQPTAPGPPMPSFTSLSALQGLPDTGSRKRRHESGQVPTGSESTNVLLVDPVAKKPRTNYPPDSMAVAPKRFETRLPASRETGSALHPHHLKTGNSLIAIPKPRRYNSRYPLPEKPRQKRAVIQDMVRPLKKWLLRHRHNPYPTKAEKVQLALGSNMTLVQLTSQTAAGLCLLYWTLAPAVIWQYMVGPLNGKVFWIMWSVSYTFGAQAFNTFAICIVLRHLTIVVYQRMLNIEDNFMAMFLLVANVGHAFFNGIVHNFCQVSFVQAAKFQGLPPEFAEESSPLKFNIPVIVALPTIVFNIYVSVRIAWKSIKHDEQDNISNQAFSLNTLARNKDVMNLAMQLGIAVLGATLMVLTPMTYSSTVKSTLAWGWMVGDIIPSFLMMVVVSNWFANARRRLKNVVQENHCSWSKRLRLYNQFVQGNAELLSISSDDSIWNSEDEEESKEKQSKNSDSKEILVVDDVSETGSDDKDQDDLIRDAQAQAEDKYKKSILHRYLADSVEAVESVAAANSDTKSSQDSGSGLPPEARGKPEVIKPQPVPPVLPPLPPHRGNIWPLPHASAFPPLGFPMPPSVFQLLNQQSFSPWMNLISPPPPVPPLAPILPMPPPLP